MRWRGSLLAAGLGLALAGGAVASTPDDPPPDVRVLGFEALLAQVGAEQDQKVRERALETWRRDFKRSADALTHRFLTEADWRPAFADAALLVDRYLAAAGMARKESPSGSGTSVKKVKKILLAPSDAVAPALDDVRQRPVKPPPARGPKSPR